MNLQSRCALGKLITVEHRQREFFFDENFHHFAAAVGDAPHPLDEFKRLKIPIISLFMIHFVDFTLKKHFLTTILILST